MKTTYSALEGFPSLFGKSRRTPQERRAQYELEKALANRLRRSSREERKELYATVYDEFFQQLASLSPSQTSSETRTADQVEMSQWRFLRRFLRKEAVFVEIGAGDCTTSFAVARSVKKVYALEVSREATRHANGPENFELLFFDGYAIPSAATHADVMYSNQVMEHLHPEDALEQLTSIYQALAHQGSYICVTPNRLTGPHDISRYFDLVATGFHLKEYTNGDLSALFKQVGFSKVKAYAGAEGFYWRCPLFFLGWLESLLDKLPRAQGRVLARLCLLYNIRLVGIKE